MRRKNKFLHLWNLWQLLCVFRVGRAAATSQSLQHCRIPPASWTLGMQSFQISSEAWGGGKKRIILHLPTFSTPVLSPHGQFWLTMHCCSFPSSTSPHQPRWKEGAWTLRASTDQRTQLGSSGFSTKSELKKSVAFRWPRGHGQLYTALIYSQRGHFWVCRLRNQDFRRKLRNVSTRS